MFNEKDLQQIQAHGLTLGQVEEQLENFRRGFPFLKVVRAASPGDGITMLDAAQADAAVARYEREAARLGIVKFVPASGAATRMFKELFEFVNEGKRGKGIDTLLAHLHEFAFWPELEAVLPAGADDRATVNAIVNDGLGYGHKPKGLVTFHAYPEGPARRSRSTWSKGPPMPPRTARCASTSPFRPSTGRPSRRCLPRRCPFMKSASACITTSRFRCRSPSTDTVAVNPDNTPFRQEDGTLLFRPAGHGALIENLNEIDADVIFIKNIDNVTTDAQRGDTVCCKKMLAGVLLDLQERAFECLKALEVGGADLEAIAAFVEQHLQVKLPADYDSALLRSILDRPIRVCGMVRNEGEPGGGPSGSRIPTAPNRCRLPSRARSAPTTSRSCRGATHFNPVDLVCGVRDSKGRKFDLRRYTDPSTGFISSKSSGGRPLRAQELPGLWNGAMARWNTVFVDVPVTTFSPVKVVQDLLRPQHR